VAEIRSVEAASGTPRTALLNLEWAERLIQALAHAGVRDAIVCAGSRSAPLALAVDRSPLRAHVALDERAGAYFALGLTKVSFGIHMDTAITSSPDSFNAREASSDQPLLVITR